jgi:hypothetical protein
MYKGKGLLARNATNFALRIYEKVRICRGERLGIFRII